MPELSLSNIDRISQDISREEITFSHLLDDLIDHVCCDVENEMQKGLSFPEAYHRVKLRIGRRRLKEIQEETLYVVDTNYRYMKNTMKISGIAGTVLFGFAALFKIQHWPLAGTMLTLGGFVLAFIFLPSLLGVLWKETRSKRKLLLFISAFFAGMFFIIGVLFKVQHWPLAGFLLMLASVFAILFFVPSLLFNRIREPENAPKIPAYILGALGLTMYLVGLLFKIQHWPMAGTLMVLGMIIAGCIAFPLYTWVVWKSEAHISPKFLIIVIASLLVMVPGAVVNLNLQRPYENGFYLNNFQEHAMYNYLYLNNKSLVFLYHDSASYPEIEQLHLRTTELVNYISDVQVKMVQESEGEPGNPAVSSDKIKQTETGVEIRYRLLSKPFHPAPVKDFLMPGSEKRSILDVLVNDYIDYLKNLSQAGDLKMYADVLKTSNYLTSGIPESPMSLISGLHSLEFLKTSVLAVEAEMIKSIVNR